MTRHASLAKWGLILAGGAVVLILAGCDEDSYISYGRPYYYAPDESYYGSTYIPPDTTYDYGWGYSPWIGSRWRHSGERHWSHADHYYHPVPSVRRHGQDDHWSSGRSLGGHHSFGGSVRVPRIHSGQAPGGRTFSGHGHGGSSFGGHHFGGGHGRH